MSIVSYNTKSDANFLKNWEVMKKPCPQKLAKKDFWSWLQFLEIQLDNFDWEDLLEVPIGNPVPPPPTLPTTTAP